MPSHWKLSELLEDNIKGKSTMSKMAAQTLKLKKRVRSVGQKFQLDAITTLDGEAFAAQNPSAAIKAVLFMPSGSFDEADQTLFKIMRIAGRDVDRRKI